MRYTVGAIPTAYAGRLYRSRLEAKWAAFFTLAGWRFEYEPFDLGGWSPDFLLPGSYGVDVLVEVKPITQFDSEVAGKISRASEPTYELLLLGVSPTQRGVADLVLGWSLLPWGEVWDLRTLPALLADRGIGDTTDIRDWQSACNAVQWNAKR